ncbi:hypothetical protein BU15DRAFT_66868 [Melanogaster broomeanus]|nr:hypothetical protein BU15DRAFT_66868 [Melanogaster broomeanus]
MEIDMQIGYWQGAEKHKKQQEAARSIKKQVVAWAQTPLKKLAQIQRAEVKKRETLECNAAKRGHQAKASKERARKREERKALPKKPRPSRGKNNVLVTSEVQNSISTPLSMPIPGPFIHQHHVHSHHDVLDLVDDPNGTDDSGQRVDSDYPTTQLYPYTSHTALLSPAVPLPNALVST